MPNAAWPRLGSDLGMVEQQHIDAAGREFLDVSGRSLPLGARERLLDGGHVIEMQRGNEMQAGGACRRRDGAAAHFIFPQPRDRFRERNMFFEVVLVERPGTFGVLYKATSRAMELLPRDRMASIG